ncbi:hypothetical protein SPD57_09255 [Streptococcus sp. BJSWXB6CM1]|uniref:Uncharacterized protein n=1 Tax=Streptococcus fermentans TaxID=3095082 RepID=A0ABU5FZ12_9STRE|nr:MULTISPECIES: hypothetical protein [unclassified Streptococcus]MDY4346612.1 hypothetical protein [Streptococcus sp. BJSWXB5TM5]MDY4361911.1 hypothetical protein [Streptococcus sp. BJSWXB3CM3]MDY4372088.1 hypothetical protein [Streptococcus sp. BJSWXB6CM1]
MGLSIENREKILNLLNAEYVIPDEIIGCVKEAVRTYSTKNYSDEVIDKIVRTPQSLSRGLTLLRERDGKKDLSLFRGILTEWLVCAEYNALKNKGSVVMTITNPDPSSKADLLHIIKIGNSFKALPGPDVKSGGSTYVFNQWKKIILNRYEIPMVDVDGILTTDVGMKKLTKKQKHEFEELKRKFPNKKALETCWNNEDILRVISDYLKFIEFEIYPGTETDLGIKDIDVKNLKTKLYSGELLNSRTLDWIVFSNESKTIFNPETEDASLVENNINSGSENAKGTNLTSSDVKEKNKKTNRFWRKAKMISNNSIEVAKKVGSHTIEWMANNPEAVLSIGASVVTFLIKNISNQEADDYISDSSYKSNYQSEYNLVGEQIVEKTGSHHASKHIRNLPEGHNASAEKIATAEEHGFSLGEGQTWVDDY